MKKFDLFKLNPKGDRPNGWIWVYLDAPLLRESYLEHLEKEPQNLLAKRISKNLRSGYSTINKHLIRLRNSGDFIQLPLQVIIELLRNINFELKWKIIKNFKYFTSKTDRTGKRVKAVKEIDENIAKIIGAHIADGYLQRWGTGYGIKICDGKQDLVERCSDWIKTTFSVKSILRFDKKDNTWSCYFNNKIIGRYFENIFDIKPGRKFDIAREPEFIKSSDFKIRKAFAKGVLMFDGGIKATGMVSLTSMSKRLIEDIYEILSLDEIKMTKRYNKKKKSWLIESRSGRDNKYLIKWLDYFEKGTWKYERLSFFFKNREYKIDELKYLFPVHHRSKINVANVYNVASKIKEGKINDFSRELKYKDFHIANTTIYKYLHILSKSGLLIKRGEKNTDGVNWWSETIYSLKK